MRTTLTLDPDVASRLQKEAAKGKRTFKQIVNDALRRGLDAPPKPRRRFVQRTWSGGEQLMSWDEIKQMLLDEDVERFIETGRR